MHKEYFVFIKQNFKMFNDREAFLIMIIRENSLMFLKFQQTPTLIMKKIKIFFFSSKPDKSDEER